MALLVSPVSAPAPAPTAAAAEAEAAFSTSAFATSTVFSSLLLLLELNDLNEIKQGWRRHVVFPNAVDRCGAAVNRWWRTRRRIMGNACFPHAAGTTTTTTVQ